MQHRRVFQQLNIYLLKVLNALLLEQSVTRTAQSLQTSQPAISESLRRLRQITSDPLFVRHGQQMIATDLALSLAVRAQEILRLCDEAFIAERNFLPVSRHVIFRVAAPDYLDPRFFQRVIQSVRRRAPRCLIEVRCLVAHDHPAVKPGWTTKQWLQADHLAPAAMMPGRRGVTDEHLARRGLRRNIVARGPQFGMLPAMVAGSSLVLATGRLFCEQFLDRTSQRLTRTDAVQK